jgi:hypothetical protein
LEPNGKLASKRYIEETLHVEVKQLEYESLIAAIPRKWKELIKASPINLAFYAFEKTIQ